MELTDLEREILANAEYIHRQPEQGCRGYGGGWFKAMNVGGSNRSPHSRTLMKMVGKELIEVRPQEPGRRLNRIYRITQLGLATFAAEVRAKNSMHADAGDGAAASPRRRKTRRARQPRRVWKTFYIESGRALNSIESVWQSWPDRSGHTMRVDNGIGMVETNLPVRDLRDLFRLADVRWRDYASDSKPSWADEE